VLASNDAARFGRHSAGWTRGRAEPPHGIGPVPAVRTLLERNGLVLRDIDVIELNEAFAAQVIACERELGFDRDKVNVNGGSISLGHPIGCSGARVVVTLVHQMRRAGSAGSRPVRERRDGHGHAHRKNRTPTASMMRSGLVSFAWSDGLGIAQVSAPSGYTTTVVEINDEI
jgi:acetyl-CoA acetyltransferase